MESDWQFTKWIDSMKHDAKRDRALCPVTGDRCIGAKYMSYCETCGLALEAFRAKLKEGQK